MQYTKQDLINAWKRVVIKTKRIPNTNEFESLGIPHINFYNRRWGNYSKFKIAMGLKNVQVPSYYKKGNLKRFFKPDEWIKFMNVISNPDHKFWFEFLLHTGMRYDEAANVEVRHIDLTNKRIEVNKAKGGRHKQREIIISSYLVNRIQYFIRVKRLNPTDTLQFPSVQFMSQKAIKIYCKKAGFQDWRDFSCHNLRKTLEMYGCALNVNTMILTHHMGHTIDTAQAYYVGAMLLNPQEKVLVRTILDDLWI